jgi:outer membrane protein OmpA-like peptidoglycan-associated protein
LLGGSASRGRGSFIPILKELLMNPMTSRLEILATVVLAGACGGTPRPSLATIEGDHILLDRHINFETDSAEIAADSTDLLDAIAGILSARSDIGVLHIIGHTDAAGEEDHNLSLSERRAAAVLEALQERGVEQSMDSRGAGESELLCEEMTEECNARNRRVELIVEMM